jgi:hypothetical protein
MQGIGYNYGPGSLFIDRGRGYTHITPRRDTYQEEAHISQQKAAQAKADAMANFYRTGMLGGVNVFGSMLGTGSSIPGATTATSTGPGLGEYDKLRNELLGQLEGYGDSQRDSINRGYDNSLDASIAKLHDRGFGNSSLIESTQLQSDRNRQSSMTELEDSIMGQKLGIGQNVGLAGLAAQQQLRIQQQQLANQLLGGFFGSLFG